ncbi:hypothetical protein A0H81_03406 [Grifola frondosa]|uniref:Uncharacterized protein n=1 Tax=Grifola frondosa TaxID=5627 RepID=A0A1C7MJY6_GRIFR|nr:hypothetical protein A0H81_03406 [Grifola frondosa]
MTCVGCATFTMIHAGIDDNRTRDLNIEDSNEVHTAFSTDVRSAWYPKVERYTGSTLVICSLDIVIRMVRLALEGAGFLSTCSDYGLFQKLLAASRTGAEEELEYGN